MTAVWGLGFMGAVGLFGAIGLFSQAWRARRGIVVPGAVVAIERRRSGTTGGSGMRSYTYAPVVEFTDRNASVHRVTAGLSGMRRPKVGSTVQVSYRPEKPEKAIVMDLPGQGAAKWVFLVVGVTCTVVAIIVAART
jgi:hypothetical protein